MSKKKIVHIINSLEQGGTETSLYRLLEKSNLDYNQHVIVLLKKGFYSDRIEQLSIPIFYLNINKKNVIKGLIQLSKILKNIEPDIIQTWLYHSDLIGGILGKIHKIPKIIWGIRCEGKYLTLSTKLIQKICAKLSFFIPDTIISNSTISQKNHITLGYDKKKITTIHNGINTTYFKQKTQFITKTTESIIIGTLGRHHPDKNLKNLIFAVDLICEKFPNVYFWICGNNCEELYNLTKKIKYSNQIKLLKPTSEVVEYLHHLDIFILPSRTEGFPNALAEAMSCGLPCIASKVGEIPSLLHKQGILIPDLTPEGIASACFKMLALKESDRAELGEQARSRINKYFSFEEYYEKIKYIYEN